MPRKTRRQKFIAQQRKKHVVNENISTFSPSSLPPKSVEKTNSPAFSFSATYVSSARQDNHKKNDTKNKTAEYGYVIHDLLKIGIFSVLAIAFQFVLVFFLRTK